MKAENETLTLHHGGMEYFRSYLHIFVPYTFLSSLGFVAGICGKIKTNKFFTHLNLILRTGLFKRV